MGGTGIFGKPDRHVANIKSSGLSIYDEIEVGDPLLWMSAPDLESLLDDGLSGISLAGLPMRTRSKTVKEHVCSVLGYPVPKTFRRTQPRFPGQQFDVYVQKSDNLQIWNEELAPMRRYVLVRVSDDDQITGVRVATGDVLSRLDTTGALTQKYQARCVPGDVRAELCVAGDTGSLQPLIGPTAELSRARPTDQLQSGQVLPIGVLFDRLKDLIGHKFPDTGHDQERNRGAAVHRLACLALGYEEYFDDGQFPDIKHQLLEIKLQTSPTVDLGLVRPDGVELLGMRMVDGQRLRHCDVRYAVFCGVSESGTVEITHVILTTGESFFERFPQFGGRVVNKKLQIPLPADFFG